MLRKIRLYIKLFWVPFGLSALGVFCWYKFHNTNPFRQQLLATGLGVGITISVANSYNNLTKYKRLKPTLGIIKLSTIPYLQNLSENLEGNLKRFDDICSIEHADAALSFYATLDRISSTYANEWLELFYNPAVVESINTDDLFNSIYLATYEQALMKKILSWRAVGAQEFIDRPQLNPPEIENQLTVQRAREWRNDLRRENTSFRSAIDKLEEEVDKLLASRGASIKFYERYKS